MCAHVCGLSGHFPFLFVVPLAYSFIASSLTPHLIIHHKSIMALLSLMTLLCDYTFILWPPFFPCMSGHFPSHYTLQTFRQFISCGFIIIIPLCSCLCVCTSIRVIVKNNIIIVQCTQMVIMTFPLQSFAYFEGSMIP